ncbi:MAG TPA: hypothetical protein VM537_22310 [Anaerolineae bacterium]|nr:hypothetical protein [Anaerolineae bacterium]
MTGHRVRIRGLECDDDGLCMEMGAMPSGAGEAWWLMPLPLCPDCGGDLVWWEAGYVPGTRACGGEPIGGRVTNPLIDTRVVRPEDWATTLPPRIREEADALRRERNTCSDARVEEIDLELERLLRPWTTCRYQMDGGELTSGCGSLFSIQTGEGRVYLRRERFHE